MRMINVLALLGMFIGVALGVTPRMPTEWRLVGLIAFLTSAVPVVIVAIRKRRLGAVMDDAVCLADDPAEPHSDGSDH
jgi:drug/metabolite transporter (DMT)-like permease